MADGLPDLADLELQEVAPSKVAMFRREEYAKRALMLFLPFRSKEDLDRNTSNVRHRRPK